MSWLLLQHAALCYVHVGRHQSWLQSAQHGKEAYIHNRKLTAFQSCCHGLVRRSHPSHQQCSRQQHNKGSEHLATRPIALRHAAACFKITAKSDNIRSQRGIVVFRDKPDASDLPKGTPAHQAFLASSTFSKHVNIMSAFTIWGVAQDQLQLLHRLAQQQHDQQRWDQVCDIVGNLTAQVSLLSVSNPNILTTSQWKVVVTEMKVCIDRSEAVLLC